MLIGCAPSWIAATVAPWNAASLALLERHGFQRERYVTGYYRDHEDRWLLTRPAA